MITPFQVTGQIDYQTVLKQFGAKPITPDIKKHLDHYFIDRGIYYSHHRLDKLLQDYHQKGIPFYIYTGRGPSAQSLHLGHYIQFAFCKYMQDKYGVYVIIQISDDEKYLTKNNSFDQIKSWSIENIKDIIAFGFNPNKTFIFTNTNSIQQLYPMILQLQKYLTIKTVKKSYGITESSTIGQTAYPAIQIAPAFYQTFPNIFKQPHNCLVVCAVDQDVYFRNAHAFATKYKQYKSPAIIHSIFLPPITGICGKMSASAGSPIFLNDTPKQIKQKIRKAHSGGRETITEHRKYGADISVDIPCIYLTFFLADTPKLRQIVCDYKAGNMLTSQVKDAISQVLIDLTKCHQQERCKITAEVLARFMSA